MVVGDEAPSLSGKPVFGLPLTLDRPTAVVCLRHPGSATTRATALALNDAFRTIDASGGAVVAILGGARDQVWDFVPRHHLLYPVLWDGDGSVRDAWGADPVGPMGLLASLPGLVALRGWPTADWRRRMTASVVRKGTITWTWRAASLVAPLPTVALIAATRE